MDILNRLYRRAPVYFIVANACSHRSRHEANSSGEWYSRRATQPRRRRSWCSASRCLLVTRVIGRSRVPNPPARMTPFIRLRLWSGDRHDQRNSSVELRSLPASCALFSHGALRPLLAPPIQIAAIPRDSHGAIGVARILRKRAPNCPAARRSVKRPLPKFVQLHPAQQESFARNADQFSNGACKCRNFRYTIPVLSLGERWGSGGKL